MTTNPFYNALAAAGYIAAIGLFLSLLEELMGNTPDTFLVPIAFLSLLTLSVAAMAYFFFYQPVRLCVEGRGSEGLQLFANTLGVFAVITVVVFAILFLLL